jgi:iron complex outermembrane receptor protein
MEKYTIKSLCMSVVIGLPAVGALTLPISAYAELEEIVVTARARSESLQDVPATITAFSESQIENMGVQRAEDFIYMTPGVTLVNTVEVGDSSLSIRGINGARDAETNFAFIVDGILYTNPSAFNREYPDLSQIEVLKGPQGALYGRSAAAGAVIMSTKKPTDIVEGSIKVTAAEHGTKTFVGTIAGPLGDNVAGRLTVDHRSSDGHLKNVYLNDNVVNDYEETGVSARLVFEPSDTLTIDTKLRYSEVDAASIAFNAAFELPFYVGALAGLSDFGVDPAAASVDVNEFDWIFSPNVDPENKQETLEFSIKMDKELDVGTLSAWALYSDQEQYFLADGTSGAFGFYNSKTHCQDSALARSLFAGDGTPMQQPTFNLGGFSPDGDPFFPPYSPTTCDGYQYQGRDQKDFSAQVSLTSSGNEALRWQVGAYYLHIDRTVGVAQLEDDGRAHLPRSYVNELTDALVLDDFTTDVYSVFGSINYDLSDQMELSFALRYDREERDVENRVPSPADGYLSTEIDYCADATKFANGCTLDGVVLNGTPLNPAFIDLSTGEVNSTVASRSKTFDAIQPKISLTYDMSDTTTLFTSWGVGFKTGGFNNLGATETLELFFVNPDGLPMAPPEIYEKETSSSFEVGFRSTLADGNLQLNGAVFHTEVDDMQFFEFYPGPFGLLRIVEGIDEATLQGFELDASWQLSDTLRFDAGYSNINGEIKKMSVRPYVAGNEVPNAADFTANMALTWDQDLNNGLNLIARLEYAYQGDIFYHVIQGSDLDSPRSFDAIVGPEAGLEYEVPAVLQLGGLATSYGKTKVDGYGIANLRIGLASDNWRVTAFAKNLTDESYVAEVITAVEFGGAFIHPGRERMMGVELEYSF